MSLKADLIFGLEVRVTGKKRGESLPVKIIWRYPDPGLKNPQTGVAKFADQYVDDVTLGNTHTYYWTLGDEWTLVPGVWTFEMWDRDRKIATQNFTLVRP